MKDCPTKKTVQNITIEALFLLSNHVQAFRHFPAICFLVLYDCMELKVLFREDLFLSV